MVIVNNFSVAHQVSFENIFVDIFGIITIFARAFNLLVDIINILENISKISNVVDNGPFHIGTSKLGLKLKYKS